MRRRRSRGIGAGAGETIQAVLLEVAGSVAQAYFPIFL